MKTIISDTMATKEHLLALCEYFDELKILHHDKERGQFVLEVNKHDIELEVCFSKPLDLNPHVVSCEIKHSDGKTIAKFDP